MNGGLPAAQGGVLPARLRALRFDDRFAALGLATSYLMSKPAFARLPFGHWSRTLAGQINRGEYIFICGENLVLGFAGWAFARAADADAWLAGREPPNARFDAGNCLIINAWAADSPPAHRFLLREIHRRAAGAVAICGRRVYADGRSRTVRIPVTRRDRLFHPRPPVFGAPSDLQQPPSP